MRKPSRAGRAVRTTRTGYGRHIFQSKKEDAALSQRSERTPSLSRRSSSTRIRDTGIFAAASSLRVSTSTHCTRHVHRPHELQRAAHRATLARRAPFYRSALPLSVGISRRRPLRHRQPTAAFPNPNPCVRCLSTTAALCRCQCFPQFLTVRGRIDGGASAFLSFFLFRNRRKKSPFCF